MHKTADTKEQHCPMKAAVRLRMIRGSLKGPSTLRPARTLPVRGRGWPPSQLHPIVLAFWETQVAFYTIPRAHQEWEQRWKQQSSNSQRTQSRCTFIRLLWSSSLRRPEERISTVHETWRGTWQRVCCGLQQCTGSTPRTAVTSRSGSCLSRAGRKPWAPPCVVISYGGNKNKEYYNPFSLSIRNNKRSFPNTPIRITSKTF